MRLSLFLVGAICYVSVAHALFLIAPDPPVVNATVSRRFSTILQPRQCKSDESCPCTAAQDDSARNQIAQCALNPGGDPVACICKGYKALANDPACLSCLFTANCLSPSDAADIVKECQLPSDLLGGGSAATPDASTSVGSSSVAAATSSDQVSASAPASSSGSTTVPSQSAVPQATSSLASSALASASASSSRSTTSSAGRTGAGISGWVILALFIAGRHML